MSDTLQQIYTSIEIDTRTIKQYEDSIGIAPTDEIEDIHDMACDFLEIVKRIRRKARWRDRFR